MREWGRTVAAAESLTGGLLAARLAAVEASAEPFPGGWVAASVEAGELLLGVPESLIQRHGMASAPVAEAFAAGARRALGTDYGLAVTGLPGPGGGTADKPVGLVFIALASREEVTSRRYQFPGRPDEVRQRAVLATLDGLRRALQGEAKDEG